MTDEKTPFDQAVEQAFQETEQQKPSPARVRANAPVSRAPRAEPKEGRARLLDPNRPISEMPDADSGGSRLSIPRSQYPDGMDLQWITHSVNGMPVPQHRQEFERRGWIPVHQEDFDGRFSGRFMAPETKGEITVDGMVLMTRPMRWTKKAQAEERRQSQEAILIKERQLAGGELEGVTMDDGARHPNALRFNRIRRTMERIDVPQE